MHSGRLVLISASPPGKLVSSRPQDWMACPCPEPSALMPLSPASAPHPISAASQFQAWGPTSEAPEVALELRGVSAQPCSGKHPSSTHPGVLTAVPREGVAGGSRQGVQNGLATGG